MGSFESGRIVTTRFQVRKEVSILVALGSNQTKNMMMARDSGDSIWTRELMSLSNVIQNLALFKSYSMFFGGLKYKYRKVPACPVFRDQVQCSWRTRCK
jgi:hypothetical protein